MKKIVLFLLGAMLLTGTLRAAKVSPETASLVAHHFMERQGVKAQLHLVECGWSEMYLFAAVDGGFVLVAGDDCVRPILAYSHGDRFADTLPEHVASWLQGYAEEIALLRSRGERASALVLAEWEALLKADGQGPLYTVAVAPMLTTTWKQGSPYNSMCPYDSASSQYTKAGCVAIAMAQVMKFWNHPAQGQGSYSYSHSTYGTLSANFGATIYDWAHMSNTLTSVSPTTNINAVATLVYHAGVSAKMGYGPSSSGATTVSANNISTVSGERALRTYFKYDKALHSMRKAVYSDSLWMALIDAELDGGRPVIYAGRDTSGGHAFVCDGRNNAGLYHFNWGWGGYCDGYYQIGALNPAPGGTGGNATGHYNLDNKVILGIVPDTVLSGSHLISAVADNGGHGSVTGGGTYNYGDTVELTATAASGYRFVHWSDGMCYNPRTAIVGGDKTYTAVYEPLTGDTLRYDNGLYQTSWGYSTARPFFWGIKLEPAVLATHTHINAVQAYFKQGGNYVVKVCNGTYPEDSNMIGSISYPSAAEGWATLAFDSALAVNTALPLWIVLYNEDLTYPACAGTYCGSSLAAYSNTNGTSWSPSSLKRTFLIRGIFSTIVPPTPPEPVFDTTVAEACGSYFWEDSTFTASGTYERLFTATSGADSLRVLLLTVHPEYHVADTVTACDSLLWIDGVTYTASVDGVVAMLTSTGGCDSVVTLTLTLGHSTADTLVVDTTEAIVWEDLTCAESGLYSQTYQTPEGCDSIKVLLLTVHEPDPPVGLETLDVTDAAVYPNPTEGVVHLRLEGVTEVGVYDVDGHLVARFASGQTVDLGGLPEGAYLLRVKQSQGVGTYRLVKR